MYFDCLSISKRLHHCISYMDLAKNICVLHLKFNAEAKVFFCIEEFFRWQSMNETSDDSKIFSYNKAEADYSISPPIQCLEGFLQRKYYGWKSAIYISISIVILFVTKSKPSWKNPIVVFNINWGFSKMRSGMLLIYINLCLS